MCSLGLSYSSWSLSPGRYRGGAVHLLPGRSGRSTVGPYADFTSLWFLKKQEYLQRIRLQRRLYTIYSLYRLFLSFFAKSLYNPLKDYIKGRWLNFTSGSSYEKCQIVFAVSSFVGNPVDTSRYILYSISHIYEYN